MKEKYYLILVQTIFKNKLIVDNYLADLDSEEESIKFVKSLIQKPIDKDIKSLTYKVIYRFFIYNSSYYHNGEFVPCGDWGTNFILEEKVL